MSSGEISVMKMLGDFYTGWFEEGIYQQSLALQLYHAIREPKSRDPNEPSSGAKPKSRPPLDVVALDLYDACRTEMLFHATYDSCSSVSCELESLYHQVRRYLGYEARMITLTKVCGACGNSLIVAEDASSDVYCTNRDCDVVYRQQDWIALLYVGDDIT